MRGLVPGMPAGQNQSSDMTDTETADQELDITKEVCPMTFVRTRLALDRMRPGQVLRVRLRGEEPLRNVPRTAREQGHEVLSLETDADDVATLLLRRGGQS
jgi:tRNA 2-thiouridine synthesizing protein A